MPMDGVNAMASWLGEAGWARQAVRVRLGEEGRARRGGELRARP